MHKRSSSLIQCDCDTWVYFSFVKVAAACVSCNNPSDFENKMYTTCVCACESVQTVNSLSVAKRKQKYMKNSHAHAHTHKPSNRIERWRWWWWFHIVKWNWIKFHGFVYWIECERERPMTHNQLQKMEFLSSVWKQRHRIVTTREQQQNIKRHNHINIWWMRACVRAFAH